MSACIYHFLSLQHYLALHLYLFLWIKAMYNNVFCLADPVKDNLFENNRKRYFLSFKSRKQILPTNWAVNIEACDTCWVWLEAEEIANLLIWCEAWLTILTNPTYSLLHLKTQVSCNCMLCFYHNYPLLLTTDSIFSLFTHLDSPLAVNAQGVHDAQHRFTVVPQVGVVLCQGMAEGLVGSCRVCQHPAVLLDLGHCDPLGWIHHQHLADQVFTVWRT